MRPGSSKSRRSLLTSLTIYFVRHGKTDWNREGRLQGQQDTPLNALGRQQAGHTGRLLRNLATNCERLDYLASPLTRARETMELMRRAAGLPASGYRVDERLKEIAFGILEGRTWKDIRTRDPLLYAVREKDRWAYVAKGGESYALVAQRIAPLLTELRRDTVVVSHGGVARALLTLTCGVPNADALDCAVWQGRILVVRAGTYGWTPLVVRARHRREAYK